MWKWLKDLFRPASKPKTPVGALGIVVGHTSKSPGAKGVGIEAEYHFHMARLHLLHAAAERHNVRLHVYLRPANLGYSAGLKSAYSAADRDAVDATAELHYNSNANKRATGSEVLSSITSESLRFAELVQFAQLKAFDLKDRGVKTRVRHGKRGWQSLYKGASPAVLIEPGFGSNPQDVASLEANWPEFADLLIAAFVEWKLTKGQ